MLKQRFLTVICTTLLMAFPLVTVANDLVTTEEKNKVVVLAFLNTMINERNVDKALDMYIDERYIQHNPGLPTGREASREAFKAMMGSMKESAMTVKRVIVQGDMVVTHSYGQRYKGDRGIALIDIFRLENGKIVEHWDVIQEIPEVTKNSNTMF